MLLNILLYIAAFGFIWFGSGLIVSSTSSFAHKLRLSPFAFSFVFLGLLTSAPEFAVGLTAISGGDPEIFVGNLLGGIPVLFLFVIPILAIFGNGINLKNELDHRGLLTTLAVILAPSVMTLDKKITNAEGIILVGLYLALITLVERRHGILDTRNMQLFNIRAYSYRDIFKLFFGIGIVFIASRSIVEQTMYFSTLFHISAFYVSLVIVSLGTNLPEISLAVRSVISGKKDIAMGDYLGSAAANTLLFGIFTLLNKGEVITNGNFLITFFFILIALTLFYVLSYTKNSITRTHGFILFGVYILFVFLELTR